ncbi:DcaP family trimeric outer membrane transporter [Telmatospirillum sp.]|uniref:DcaP family trimeric outer membrane transporter n=1 Tax=Telmatospirillum sp. TaxID=2079197 RepID=UPI00284C472C|nr:DcaP family trimeric outer membrane transporter [Telmatospirillum sp.]MDR3435777.1 DcaP family trimeric outer membrane transporter [Telmatospirillum sp.]
MKTSAAVLSAMALSLGAAVTAPAAHADDTSEMKALIKELKAEINEQRTQVRELKSEVTNLNAKLHDQTTQVADQTEKVKAQSATIEKVEAKQQVLEQKQAGTAPDSDDTVKKSPGYFSIPGTKTVMKIGGYAKLDMVDDVSGNIGTGAFTKTATDFSSIPLDSSAAAHRGGQVNFTAQESRLNVTTLTPTDQVGDVKSVIETDFYGNGKNNSGNVLRLRHAYVSADGFTAGQTWSTFMDLDTAGPEVLDFDGPVGYIFVRQPQVRYTAAVGKGAVSVALESPSGDVAANTADVHIDKAPDIVAKYSIDPSWGHFAIAGLGRYLSVDSGEPGQHGNKTVYGVMSGLGLKTFGKDMATLQVAGGDGLGRYMNQGQGISAIQTGYSLKPINIWGGTLGYTHFWTDVLRSSVAYGYDHFTTPAGDSVEPIKTLTSVHANLIWSPWDSADVGIEYIWGHITTAYPDAADTGSTATKGSASRVQGSVKYTF